MTLAQQLNAVLRFSVYYATIMLVLKNNLDSFVFPVITAAITYIVFHHFEGRHGERAEAFSKNNISFTQDGVPCTVPTKDNPFMNLLSDEYNTPKPEACDALEDDMKQKIDRKFRKGTFVDQDDIYNRNFGSRQFYTNPVTTNVNDQKAFAEWLYGGVNCSGKQVRPPPT
eukprot:jgi/Tetstr1/447249/TSEL_034686.t1